MGMAERIREKRISANLTQEELGVKLGLQKSAIAKYENGRVENIKRSVIAQMAEILNTTPAYLMGWEIPTKKYGILLEELLKDSDDANMMLKFIQLNNDNKEIIKSLIDTLEKQEGNK